MNTSDYTIITLIFLGAILMLMSMKRTKKIFNILPNNKLKDNWKKLSLLMLIFFIGYLLVVILVILGKTELLAFLSGVIFFMGSLFVFIVVSTGLDSFIKLKNINQNLNDTQLKNKELEQFAHITSHDLKAPLRGISSLATFIKEDLEAGQNKEVFNHISILQEQVERLENLINGILNYSKIGKLTLAPVDLNLLINEELNNYKRVQNVIFKIKNKLPTVNGDKVQLSQIISNIISNAIKYNDKDVCKISIYSIEKPKSYEITFEDNGPGIPSKYHQKIFEIFQTISKKQTYESTGIGLSIVKKIIEKHNGNIWIESNGKLGTKFIISYSKTL